MSILLKVGLLLIFVALAVLIAFSMSFYLRPLATTVWFRRNALSRAGFHKTALATTVGTQMVWHGGSGPVLVLLHGASDQAGTWSRVVSKLKANFEVVMPDLAGHGESEPFSGPLSLGTLLGAFEQVLEAPQWHDLPLTLVGNSLGAWLAMLYADTHPCRVKRLLLAGGGPVKNAVEIGLMPKDREEARRVMDAALDPSSPRPANFVLDDLIRVSNSGPIARLFAAGVEDMYKYLLEGRLANFPVPVDLIWGASDRIVPLDYAKKLQAQLPRCTLTVIDRCGHAPQLERPRQFTRVLFEILASPPAPAPAREPSVSMPGGENT